MKKGENIMKQGITTGKFKETKESGLNIKLYLLGLSWSLNNYG